MMYWFTADQHFNHENIITKFVFRKFNSVEHMNAEIIKRHNDRVKPFDTVFHLGDFRMSSQGPTSHELRKQLNGNHVFICGNHDKNNGTNSPLKYAIIETFRHRVLLIHNPEKAKEIMEWNQCDMCFCGHVHEKWKFRENIINIGVDQWDYYPIDAKQILKAYKKAQR